MFFSTRSLNPLKQIIIFTDSRIGTLRWSSFTHPVLVYPELAEGLPTALVVFCVFLALVLPKVSQ